jgi:1-acyl-sn-glycerol-3-phosphate acyltransferase
VRVRKLERKRGYPFVIAASIVKPVLFSVSTHEWIDAEKIPAKGGCVLVLNHVSHLDPLTTAHVVYDHGRLPRYLAKDGLFRSKALGRFLRDAGQIPVTRASREATGAYDAAVAAVDNGECVIVYPEGSITKDPDAWPMRGKTGAARIALATGAPVIPVGQWGAQKILPPYAKRPHLFPRSHVRVLVGDPVELDDLRAQPITATTIREATDRIMQAITELVEKLRGETAPAERFDPRKAGVQEFGNPNKPTKDEA